MILSQEGPKMDGRKGSLGWSLVVPTPLSTCFLCKQVSSTAAPAAIWTYLFYVNLFINKKQYRCQCLCNQSTGNQCASEGQVTHSPCLGLCSSFLSMRKLGQDAP